MTLLKRARSAYYGWRILAASGIIGTVTSGLAFYGFTVFFLPISRSLELSRAAASSVFSLSRAEGFIGGPLSGYLIDRWGPRTVLFVTIALMGAGYMLLSRVDSFAAFLVVYIGVISIGFNAGIVSAPMAAVNTWFVRKRGFAMGVLLAASSLGGALIAPVLSFYIAQLGWRITALFSGIAVLIILLPLSLVFRRSPESMGLLPDGDSEEKQRASKTAPGSEFRVGDALRTGSFWLLTAASALRIAGHTGMMVHFVPIAVWRGMSEQEAAVLLGILAFMGIPLRVLLGWAIDRMPKSRVIGAGIGAGAIALYYLSYAEPGWQLWTVVLFLAVGEAVGPLNWVLVGDFFGRQRYATIRGTISIFTSIAGAVTPVMAGIIYDNTQSYEVTLWILSAFLVLSAVAFGVLRPPAARGTGE